ncbi:cyanophycinase [Pontibacter ummariensis]|uniref:Cyanophycinase n=1 Tax=Pontibacter ummariensis TaxID=1610492 RepID=A0A239LM29_9BACT|nr:cyanophycinase [Pontibacter ummariensis]PRY02939.1 cyanophycinase [Pontibacter ummariensis]SNT31531.1 cyanophycinase [Pontibacter ummariensis]
MAAKSKSPQNKAQRLDFPTPKGILLAIGGKESKSEEERPESQEENTSFVSEQILKRFVKELQGKDPLVLVVPAATNDPEPVAREYVKLFRDLGVDTVKIVDIRTRDDAKDPEKIKLVDKAAGIMLTGGDQLRLTSILGGSLFMERIKERYMNEKFVVAGTSAGAAAMSTNMIYKGEAQGGMLKDQMSATAGLDLLKNVAIDTHFIDRGRIIRMAQAVAQNPGCIGIGLEEDTAILVKKGMEVEVVGSGLVTILDGMNISSTNIYEIEAGDPFTIYDLKMHLLGNGKTYTIPAFNIEESDEND